MGLIIIDSDVLIDLLRGREDARRIVSDFGPTDIAACSAITIAEITAGMRIDEETATMALIDSMLVMPVDRDIAQLSGKLKASAKGLRLELDDCLIAATVIVHHATLVTHNPRHYPFADLDLQTADY